MLVLAFAAALSITYFVTLGILFQPIPSRTLTGLHLVPNPVAASSLASNHVSRLHAKPVLHLEAPPRRPLRAGVPRPLPAIQVVSVREAPASDNPTPSAAAGRERRPNFLGRLFRGMLRTVQPPRLNVGLP